MKVTKISEVKFEVEIDQSERNTLDVVESIYEKPAVEIFEQSLDETMKQMELGTSSLMNAIANKLEKRKGV